MSDDEGRGLTRTAPVVPPPSAPEGHPVDGTAADVSASRRREKTLSAAARQPSGTTSPATEAVRVSMGGRRAAVVPRPVSPYADRDASYAALTAATPVGRQCPTPAHAAAAVLGGGTYTPRVAWVSDAAVIHLVDRATFGGWAADHAAVRRLGINTWIDAQLSSTMVANAGRSLVDRAFPLAWASIPKVRASVEMYSWDAADQTSRATLGRQMFSNGQLNEVVVDVMSNVLNVTTPGEKAWDSAGDYAAQVIRRHAFGKYSNMLHDAARHPAMLSYLDNAWSNKDSVNENYGRELLELHTIGVDGGYTESDVRNSAYILSGRSIDWDTGAFRYRPEWHWTGMVNVVGFRHGNTSDGLGVGDHYLRCLAEHPATARRIARALAVRFVSDTPSVDLINRLAAVYRTSGTDIRAVVKAIFCSTDFWAARQAKTRRPMEDVIGAVRALECPTPTQPKAMQDFVGSMSWVLETLGHRPLSWQPPNGYPDVVAAWSSASGMIGRWNAHRALASGWWGIQPKIDTRFAPSGKQSYAQWIDAIAVGVLHRPISPARRGAIWSFVSSILTWRKGISINSLAQPEEKWLAPTIAAFVLDGPDWMLR